MNFTEQKRGKLDINLILFFGTKISKKKTKKFINSFFTQCDKISTYTVIQKNDTTISVDS
jgi:hypothetical protein